MIINIRGTNGSGKTYLVRGLIKRYHGKPLPDSKGKPAAYRLDGNIIVIGKYDVACGGADTLPKPDKRNSMDVVENAVRYYADLGYHVIFEGLIVSSVWGRWEKLAADYPTIFIFLDGTPEYFMKRVKSRNGGKPLKNEDKGWEYTHLGSVWSRCQGHYKKAVANGMNVIQLKPRGAWKQLQELVQREIFSA